ncbi:MAG: type II toxin-antitoxin system VapB family antitoxin [Aquamicrobium sp.]|nr:type II toxin-antitoxin system VapB family antitoxin [Aquamicrobium sp.]
MVLHVRDEKTDALVRALAHKRGISLTEAVREAVEEALARDEQRASLWDRTADLRAKLESYPLTGKSADKRFFDSLSGQGDD